MVKSISLSRNSISFTPRTYPFIDSEEITITNTGNETVTVSTIFTDNDEITTNNISTLTPSALYDGVQIGSAANNILCPRIKMIDDTKGVVSYRKYGAGEPEIYSFFTVSEAGEITALTERSFVDMRGVTVLPLDELNAIVVYTDPTNAIKAAIYEIDVDELVNPGTPITLSTGSYSSILTTELFMIDPDLGRVFCGYEHVNSGLKVEMLIMDCDTVTKTVSAYAQKEVVGPGGSCRYPKWNLKDATLGGLIFYDSFGAINNHSLVFSIDETTITTGNIVNQTSFCSSFNRDIIFISENKYIIAYDDVSTTTFYSVYGYTGVTSTLLTPYTSLGNYVGQVTLARTGQSEIALFYGKNTKFYNFFDETNLISEAEAIATPFTFIGATTFLDVVTLAPFGTYNRKFLLIGTISSDLSEIVSSWTGQEAVLTVSFATTNTEPQEATITILSDAVSSPDRITVSISGVNVDYIERILDYVERNVNLLFFQYQQDFNDAYLLDENEIILHDEDNNILEDNI